jgi:hypothetical protein
MIFDDLPVKAAVREAVQRKHVEPVLIQPLPQPLEVIAGYQMPRSLIREAKTHAEIVIGRNPILQRNRVPDQIGFDLGPAFSGMNIRAVGEVKKSVGSYSHERTCLAISNIFCNGACGA